MVHERAGGNAIADIDLPDDRDSDREDGGLAFSVDSGLSFEGYIVHECAPEDALARLREFVTDEKLQAPEPHLIEENAISRLAAG
jgi:hypothetical protein